MESKSYVISAKIPKGIPKENLLEMIGQLEIEVNGIDGYIIAMNDRFRFLKGGLVKLIDKLYTEEGEFEFEMDFSNGVELKKKK